MLEGLVTWVLNNYLGKYVENLNTDQLSIALLSGEVELENLPLKKDALRNLNLPIEIKTGFIGKIKLQIPVRQLRSAAWVILIEQLYVVASPVNLDEWNADVEERVAHEFKLSALAALEAQWRLERNAKESETYYGTTYSSWLNFGTGVLSDILENLQLKIRDVHVRYEDSISIPNEAVGFGLTIESLSAQSCDSNWLPGITSFVLSDESFKLLELDQLAIYWTTVDKSQLFSKMSISELKTAMSSLNSNGFTTNYILPPVSAQAHLKRHRSELPLRSSETPRIVCDLHLQEVPFTLNDKQYEQMVKCVQGIHNISYVRKLRHYRPNCTIESDPRAWWLYAISVESPNGQPNFCKPRPTWEYCHERAKQNVAYVKLYKDILLAPAAAIPPDTKYLKDVVEWSRTYDELKVLREIAMKQVPKLNDENNTSSASRSVLVEWFPQWLGWYSSPAHSTNADNSETANLNGNNSATLLEGEILEALQDSVDNNTLLKRDVIFGRFNFSLNSGSFSLCTTGNGISNVCVPMLELQFKTLSLKIVSKPRSSSYSIELSLGALYLHDKLTANSLFSILVGPPGQDRLSQMGKCRGSSSKLKSLEDTSDPLFYLAYERKSENNYRLQVRSKSLDVVYQPAIVKWVIEFFCLPHQKIITQKRIEAVKLKTKKELIKNWESILQGSKASVRTNWELQLDISAPQIIFVEQFNDINAAMAVVDFGRFQMQNLRNKNQLIRMPTKESEDDDMFMTPCSTPPGSETSLFEPLPANFNAVVDEKSFHSNLYDQYSVELTDLQILIGRVKDNWRYAHNRGSSSMHILDRFNISLQIEHRVVHTSDPHYPSLMISSNLPKLVAHLNEQKISLARGLIEVIRVTGLPSPFTSDTDVLDSIIESGRILNLEDEESISIDMSIESSKLLVVQFTVDQLALEVQSRGRSIAELQVSGVKAIFSKTPQSVNISLSVHSLLLVDALQTFGRDFELLVASHKHVGMDSMSGSIRDSEPTSPTSPASPEPSITQTSATSPIALTLALNTLTSSPLPARIPVVTDSETLISIEITLVTDPEPLRVANIQFNNLDLIANQETIVELLGFTQRVFPEINRKKSNMPVLYANIEIANSDANDNVKEEEIPLQTTSNVCRMELTFDFHRLNILILRGIIKDDCIYGRKIGTATMSKAKIRATVDKSIIVEGSLGGLQVLDLTPEGHFHQRIISVGHDPLIEVPHSLYSMSNGGSNAYDSERQAFSFQVSRKLPEFRSSFKKDVADVKIRMASVWYTHSPKFLMEMQSCVSEFQQYLANLARSIRSAATDMALGLVHARAEALAQSLSINSRLASSLYGSAISLSEIVSPRKRSRHSSIFDSTEFQSGNSSIKETVPQTPYTPAVENDNFIIDMKLDIVLDSPVVVLPKCANSNEVFVAHLGKTTVSNYNNQGVESGNITKVEQYNIEVRDMNLFSLDTSSRRVPGLLMNKPETLYCCEAPAKPILHNTVVQLCIHREIENSPYSRHHSLSNLLDGDIVDDNDFYNQNFEKVQREENITVTGSVVTALKVSLNRTQYEQLLDTFHFITTRPTISNTYIETKYGPRGMSTLDNISEEDTGVTTLKMDPHVRAKLFPSIEITKPKSTLKSNVNLKISFELPVFTIELRGNPPNGEQSLIDLSFQDFLFNYERGDNYETNIEVSLRSIVMEDLLQPPESRHRDMVISSSGDTYPRVTNLCLSHSCPNIHVDSLMNSRMQYGSLPDHLEPSTVLGISSSQKKLPHCDNQTNTEYPMTPPPSRDSVHKYDNEKNLVLISCVIVDSAAPNFETYYNSVHKKTSVDFNCLDLAITVESWVVVLDFFGTSSGDQDVSHSSDVAAEQITTALTATTDTGALIENTESKITVKSLSVTLVKSEHEIAKANISNVDLLIKTKGLHKEVEGALGCMSLLDLTLQGQLYKERFLTSGQQALQFKYIRCAPNETLDYDASLKLDMSSILYVHTKRFVVELEAFLQYFTQLQSVMQGIRAAASSQQKKRDSFRLSFHLQAGAPVILIPVHSRSSNVLIADLGELHVKNCFKNSGDKDTISLVNPNLSNYSCLLDVMSLDLQNMDLYCGIRNSDYDDSNDAAVEYFKFGVYKVSKNGPSLLTKKCYLKIQVERNLDRNLYHAVPDMSLHGELSTLDVALDLHQYQLVKNLLIHNLGENTEHILSSVPLSAPLSNKSGNRDVWTLTSLKFDLSDVILRLQINHDTLPLACINFVKSRLTVESFSNLSQDVDLISQEILVTDTRFQGVSSSNKKCNIFTNILQPINVISQNEIVQAEIHSRRRQDRVKFTILLNNMRLMAVFDWWDAVLRYLLEDSPDIQQLDWADQQVDMLAEKNNAVPFELKMNITDSEIIVVEDSSHWDTNAVIFKSTTVLSYKPYVLEKPLSCNLNNCEMYSCILGMEEETALSIIDPVTLNMEINKNQTLDVQLQTLMIRLSYHDMRMFLKILNSLPQQLLGSKTEVTQTDDIKFKLSKLTALGFLTEDCLTALNENNQRLDDAALWLTQNANPSLNYEREDGLKKASLHIVAVDVKADCISLCIIDDCGDSDVPLLEISLAQLNLHQRVGQVESSEDGEVPVEGALECRLSADYYNRLLSGWEPIIEPWKCIVVWDHVLTTNLSKNRLLLNIESHENLNFNITSSLADLYKQTRDNWLQDYYAPAGGVSPLAGYRRRSPFVPFALRNETGLLLHFTTVISDLHLNIHSDTCVEVTDSWMSVAHGDTVPFSFRSHDKRRHGDSHHLKMHQLGVKIEGWKTVYPVTVDKVGTYFRYTSTEKPDRNSDTFFIRIVFDVALEGSARKLVTVRSSLVLINNLQEDVEIKFENTTEVGFSTLAIPPIDSTVLCSNAKMSVPLPYLYSQIYMRPIQANKIFTFCNPSIYYVKTSYATNNAYLLKTCHNLGDPSAKYRFCAKIRKDDYHIEKILGTTSKTGRNNQPAHTITLLPTLLIINLLPMDLTYILPDGSGRISPGGKMPITCSDADYSVELKLGLENFAISSPLVIAPTLSASTTSQIRMEDMAGRRLFLHAHITPNEDARFKVTISAQYWIINKTGIPLVFRQRGVNSETAGQFEEHEIARMVAPLLFSFSDPDASTSVVVRVGSAVVPNGMAQWSDSFDLQPGIKVRNLNVTMKDGKRDVSFLVGIEVRTGRGQYRYTNIIVILPRYQLFNKSSYKLMFSQKCYATTIADPEAELTYLDVVPNCHIPFNWKRPDREQILCVLIKDIPNCRWSGGFKIDKKDSRHLNIRDDQLHTYFLRLEIILQRATFFVIFTDADKMPPPIRIDNFSEVSITYSQHCCKNTIHSVARAHASVPYAWDEPMRSCNLNIVVPGGVSSTYDMTKLGKVAGLTYENFIYIALTGTFKNGEDSRDPLDVESQQLVLDVVNNTRVVLARKQAGKRSQLWRMTTTGQLQHEGSSPPSFPQQKRPENVLVLDIEGPAPQPNSYTPLMLRRLDPRRRSTQTWRFTEEGRLCCAHYNMCVQAQDGFFGLRQGNTVVLGLPQPVCHRITNTGIPLEQAIFRQRLRPGSGFLSLEIQMDGPTRVLTIRDMKQQQASHLGNISTDFKNREVFAVIPDDRENAKEMQFTLRLVGLSISLISRQPSEELLFARFSTIISETVLTPFSKSFCISVKDVQFDNQLFDSSIPVLLYVTQPNIRSSDDVQYKLPALEITADIQPRPDTHTVIFRHFMIRLKKLTVNLEEKLLLKLCIFFKAGSSNNDLWNNVDESDFEVQRLLNDISATHSKRYYFGIIQIMLDQIRLSLKTANKLPTQLQKAKRTLDFILIKFEDAAVDLEPFIRHHLFETSQILSQSIIKHFKDELIWQAVTIVGTIDLLGNPLGLMNDVTEGVSGLLFEGSIRSLVKNVTHGLSNSAAKVTESLSDGLGRVAMDEKHEETRQKLRQIETGRSSDHLLAGIKGLSLGVLGGATSIFTQVYEGGSRKGVQGVVLGLGKGVVGAVTKPLVGVLDLASETARAVRDSSRSSNRVTPERIRPPRCVKGPGDLLPPYSFKQSQGQQYLYLVNNRSYTEQLVAYECLRSGTEDLRIIISSERVRIITGSYSSLTTVLETHLSDFLQCQPVTLTEGSGIKHYIEIIMRVTGSNAGLMHPDPKKKPRIRCDSMELAHSVSQQLSYAKRLYNDRIHTVGADISQVED